jgi:hypothetical protein
VPSRRRWLHTAGGLGLLGLGLPGVGRARDSTASKAAETWLGRPWALEAGQVLVLPVDPQGLSLAKMLDAVAAWTVPANARLVLELADGEHLQRAKLSIDHPHGARLSIVSRAADASRCVLVWEHETDALTVGAGCALGWLDGVSLRHAAPRRRGLGSGVLADEGGAIRCGRDVRVANFYYGFTARRNGSLRCDGAVASNGGDANFFAFQGGHLSARGARAELAADRDQRLGSGFVAEYGGSIDAQDSVSRQNLLDGYTALSNGSIRAYGTLAQSNARAGYYADTGGRIVAHQGRALTNCQAGIAARDGQRSITGNRLVEQAPNGHNPDCTS